MFNSFGQLFKKDFSLKFNVLANFVGNFWTALMTIAFVPIYMHYIGVEALGLLGVFASVQAAMWFLDIGIGATVSRELARSSTFPAKYQEMRDMVRTVELIIFSLAILTALLSAGITYILAHYWITPENLPISTIERAFLIMSVTAAFQFLLGFYNGCLLGLQKLVLLNILNVIFATLRGFGSLVVLFYVSSTIEAFLIWQGIVALLQTIAFFIAVALSLPRTNRPSRFRLILLRKIWGFATGLTLAAFLGLLMSQADKIILSRMISLEDFGYYSLATMVVAGLSRLVKPVFDSFYPRLNQLVAAKNVKKQARVYHQGTQVMSVMLAPISLMICFFSYEILYLWTQNAEKTDNTYLILTFLMAGNLFNGIYQIPYALQLAHGETKLQIYGMSVFVCIFIPLMILVTPYFGGVGVASLWFLMNFIYLFVMAEIMHRSFLRREKAHWYLEDVFAIIFASLVPILPARYFIQSSSSDVEMFVSLAFASLLTLGCAVFSASYLRKIIREYFKKEPA